MGKSVAKEYIAWMVSYGFEISTISFDGPFAVLPKGNELANLPSDGANYNIYCRLKIV
jgi:hypothetical protein